MGFGMSDNRLDLDLQAGLVSALQDAVSEACAGIGARTKPERRRRERAEARFRAASRWNVIRKRAAGITFGAVRLDEDEQACRPFVVPRCRPVDGGAPHESSGPPAGGEHLSASDIMARSASFAEAIGECPASKQDR